MTKIKFCGLRTIKDINTVNILKPDYIGFVFASKSKRYVSHEEAAELKRGLDPEISAVGVFVDEDPAVVSGLLNNGTIDIAQLHGNEDDEYISNLRLLTDKPIIKAYKIRSADDLKAAERSPADHVLLDSGAGTGQVFDWGILERFNRPYFLAGGLEPNNVSEAIRRLHPFAVDVSSGIETDGIKDTIKMELFKYAVMKEDDAVVNE